jgi:hypothetical protein
LLFRIPFPPHIIIASPRGDAPFSRAAESDGAAAAAKRRKREQAIFILEKGRGGEKGLALCGGSLFAACCWVL